MSTALAERAFGPTERIFIVENPDLPGTFLVRPATAIVDGNQIRFRNFTSFPVTIAAPQFLDAPLDLGPGKKDTVPLKAGVTGGYYEYGVVVAVGGEKGRVEAAGNSRPGVIIDR